MRANELKDRLESFPIIAAIRDNRWRQALNSPAEILFYLEANILTVRDRIRQAHEHGKIVFVHLDLAEGIALALEFKLGGEVLRTVIVREWTELLILGAIIALRGALTLLIHWEISVEEKREKAVREGHKD